MSWNSKEGWWRWPCHKSTSLLCRSCLWRHEFSHSHSPTPEFQLLERPDTHLGSWKAVSVGSHSLHTTLISLISGSYEISFSQELYQKTSTTCHGSFKVVGIFFPWNSSSSTEHKDQVNNPLPGAKLEWGNVFDTTSQPHPVSTHLSCTYSLHLGYPSHHFEGSSSCLATAFQSVHILCF